YKIGTVYKSLGEFYLQTSDYDKAYISLKKALKIYKAKLGDNNPRTLSCYGLIGDYYKKTNNFKPAFENYNLALQFFYKNPEIPLIDKLNYLDLLNKKADLYYVKALKSDDLSDWVSCGKIYDEVIALINKLKVYYLGNNNRMRFISLENEVFSRALLAKYKLYTLTKQEDYLQMALNYAEMSKASVLNTFLNDANSLVKGSVPDSIINIEKSLNNRINYLENKRNIKKDILTYENSSSRELFDLYAERESLIKNLEQKFPKYYELKYKPVNITFEQIKNYISANEVILEYSLADNSLFVFAISKNKAAMYKQEIDSSFYKQLNYIHNFISYNPWVGFDSKYFSEFTTSSYNLYKTLLQPVENEIRNKKLIIIPDAELNYLPFDILLTSMPNSKQNDYGTLPYLILKNTVSYQYSVTTLKYLNKKPAFVNSLATFAPIYNKANNEADLATRSGYSQLNGALKEVKEIAGFFTSKSFIGREASEENFKSNVNSFNIVHLAMHAFLNDDNPMYSNLLFSDTANSKEDGRLNTYEIFNMHLKPDLLVLSACNTGNGKLKKGEGVLSIARSFVYSGCPSLVLTLWKLNDKSGALLMHDFYANLSRGLSKDIALQNAKLNYIHNADEIKLHPYYWAGYVNIGNTLPLVKKAKIKTYKAFIPIFIIILLFPITLFSFYYRKRRNRF
ncbi:MAG: CHAT domain-containing protein, partial [Chlorobi bacterium]|nr:CHAT domain-containing protein [Chlorobiota bacterium]